MMTQRGPYVAGAALFAAAIALVVFLRPARMDSHDVHRFWPMTAQELSDEGFHVVPVILETIYQAFSETDEAAIYDALAEVAAGEALETLYLERVGSMAGGGLDGSDQQLHAMELVGLSSRRSGARLDMDVTWQVVGTVGHATHLHVRGNTYAADLTIAPVDGAWRLTAFDLIDVDRTDAGTMVAAQ